MTIVQDLIGAKTDASRYALKANETVDKAIRLMANAHIGAVLVVEDGKVVGIFTERDYVNQGEVEGRTAKTTLLREVMTNQLYTVTTQTSVELCMALMIRRHIRHLPVVDDGKLAGIISMRDAVAVVLKDQEIKEAENYGLTSSFQG